MGFLKRGTVCKIPVKAISASPGVLRMSSYLASEEGQNEKLFFGLFLTEKYLWTGGGSKLGLHKRFLKRFLKRRESLGTR